ncbi:uncharacterized protein LOC115444623 [Manduca sexta]|uniref:uncharacterized protein LOC115444623 n=1 Tax=Manduca sexta TaxID=7130 RepID=UPI00188EF0D4|nr:uncharacterized protein LOC115444623 [Manduca sexta]
MKITVLIILLAKGVISANEGKRSVAEVDALLKAVTEESWRDDEKPCFNAVVAMLDGVHNSTLWATWMWDSNQRPVGTLYGLRYHLGNYDQCLSPPWLKEHPELRPQYCLLDFQLSEGNLLEGRSYFEPYEPATTYINVSHYY